MVSIVCLLVAAMPASFGPHQNQAYLLSRELDRLGYHMRWMMHSPAYSLPEKEHKSAEAVSKKLPRETNLAPTPPAYNLSHLTFLGKTSTSEPTRVSQLNKLAKKYGIDAYIVLADIASVLVRDADFKVTSIAWHSQHYEKTYPLDNFVLKAFTHVAPLAPSAAEVIKPKIEPMVVEHIPHIVDIDTVERLHGEPSKDVQNPLESSITPGTFVVLFQGGNYEPYDRKGVDIAVQAFERFHAVHPNSVLLFHAISSLAIMQESHYGKGADPAKKETAGVPLHARLAISNLSKAKGSFQIMDQSILPLHQAFAYKRMANVCLHPSRAEGFGLNMMECQAVGTPVITTEFLAMKDFTRYGVAVRPRQKYFYHRGMVSLPDVPGVADALFKAYHGEGPEFDPDKKTETQRWIAQQFSPQRVGGMFKEMLDQDVEELIASRKQVPPKLFTLVQRSPPPFVDIDTLWVVCAPAGAELNEEVIAKFILETHKKGEKRDVLLIPAQYKNDKSTVRMLWYDQKLHPDQPFATRTQLFLEAQLVEKSLREIGTFIVHQDHAAVGELPPGLAFV